MEADQLLYSLGGFVVGVLATVGYAKATGRTLQWPWRKGNTNHI